jgi:UDP-N-acetylmuramoylalanine--D-glutamate ligase
VVSPRTELLRAPAGRRVVVAGAGRQGLGAARLLSSLGATVRIVDDGEEEGVRARVAQAGLDGAVEVTAGGFEPGHTDDADLLVLSAGLPRRHPAVSYALARGLPVVNEVEVGAAQLEETTFVGITGTNGKSTTTTMLGCIAQQVDGDAFVGGNLGTTLCEAVVAGDKPRLAVVELSSYQLETIEALPLRAAVVTNLAPDHLDRYDSVDDYYLAKRRILDLLTPVGVSCLNRADAHSRRVLLSARTDEGFDFGVLAGGEGVATEPGALVVRLRGDETRLPLDNPHIVGPHNAMNAAAAVAAAAVLGLPPSAWTAGLAAYGGIAHRLERLGDAAGVTWFNDSKATNVDAAITAVRSFEGGVHLIAGGQGKGASYAPLAEAARGRVRALYTIGADAEALGAAFAGAAPVVDAGTLAEAVEQALARADEGDVLLLAPACASFDQFASYVQRGDAFRALFAAHGGRA